MTPDPLFADHDERREQLRKAGARSVAVPRLPEVLSWQLPGQTGWVSYEEALLWLDRQKEFREGGD